MKKPPIRHIHTDAFDLYVYEDGAVVAMPPPRFIVELTGKKVSGEVSDRQMRDIFDAWRSAFWAFLSRAVAEQAPAPPPAAV